MIYYKVELKKNPNNFFIGTTLNFEKAKMYIKNNYKKKTNNLFKKINEEGGINNFEIKEFLEMPLTNNFKIEKKAIFSIYNPTIKNDLNAK